MLDGNTIREINTCPPAKSKAEERYIRKRKIKAFFNSLAFYMCRIFPIDKKLVSVCTFEGKGGFGCNPKYIVKELHKQRPDVKFVWFVNKDIIDKKEFPDYIKKVPNTLWSRAYWLTRSKVWIDNYRKPYGTVKRKGQYYINTWHGSIFIKPLGLLRGTAFSKMAYLVSKNDSDMIDSFLMDSNWCVSISKEAFVYDGKIENAGMPRLDKLYGDRKNAKKNVREKYNIPLDSKILMYAPTFREAAKAGKRSVYAEEWSIDFERVMRILEQKEGSKWYICLRVHPQLAAMYADKIVGDERFINGSNEDDMYELLAGMDAYMTDYSSTAFEAAYAGIPVYIYADDIEKYANDRGSLMWNIVERDDDKMTRVPHMEVAFPFDVARSNDELEKQILNFDYEQYCRNIKKFEDGISLVFDGKASQKVALMVTNFMEKE